MLKLLTSRWLWGALGVTALALVIWYLGPLLALADWRPLESVAVRSVAVAAVVLAWLARRILAVVNTRQAEQKLVQGVVAPTAAVDQSAEEIETLKQRFEEAIGVLKASRGRRGRLNLYDLPWYIIIGPPGAGKTLLAACLPCLILFPLFNPVRLLSWISSHRRGPCRGVRRFG